MLHNENKKNGKVFVAIFLGVIVITGLAFCYAMIESYKTRPQVKPEVKIEDEKK